MAAVSAILSIPLSVYCYIDGDTILECVVLIGLGMLMAFVAITGPRKPNSD